MEIDVKMNVPWKSEELIEIRGLSQACSHLLLDFIHYFLIYLMA